MVTYTVWIRPPGPGLFRPWTKYTNVDGDGFDEEPHTGSVFRYLQMADGGQLHFPVNYEVRFSKERLASIQKKASQEAGQGVQMAR